MKAKRSIKLLITAIFIALCFNSYSQLGVTSYSIYALGVNTSQNKIISGELKTFANSDIEDLLFEADMFYNFKPKAFHRVSVGIGMNGEPFSNNIINAITIPFN